MVLAPQNDILVAALKAIPFFTGENSFTPAKTIHNAAM